MAIAIVQSRDQQLLVLLQEDKTETDSTVAGDDHSAEGSPAAAAEAGATVEAEPDPKPLEIVPAELYWAGGSFLVLLVLMRWVLYPRVAGGMAARSAYISGNLDAADRDRDAAQIEKQRYEEQLAGVRAEINRRLDAARIDVEADRKTALAAVNTRLAELRQGAQSAAAEARAAAEGQVVAATSGVVTHAASIVLGRAPDAEVVRQAVAASMSGASNSDGAR